MREFFYNPPQTLQKSPAWQGMCQVIKTLLSAGYQAYLVGGGVRDMLLGKAPKDLDVTTSATPEQISALFEKAIPLGASFGVITVLIDAIPYEVATVREEREYSDGRHPEQILYTNDVSLDVARRDFTINALLFDPVKNTVIDYVGGLDDLKHGILRTVGDPELRFREDHLRMLRAVRFAARLGYKTEGETLRALSLLAPLVKSVSPERIREELEKMLLHTSREQAFRLLAETGLLRQVLPEIDDLRGVTQPVQFHPEGDVFEHTMLMLSHIAVPSPALVWAVLLHDVGKPATRSVKDGIPHFYGHEAVGADMAEVILKRLHHSNAVIESVVPAVRNHMRFAHIDKMKAAKWKRIAADKNFPVELELHRIDCISCHALMGNYLLMLDRLAQLEREAKDTALPPPLLNGGDLIRLGMKPGPAMGILLHEITDLQLENELRTKEEALAFARAKLFTMR